MAKLEGKTAIVTGGAMGIGRHYTEALVREGATVAIVDIGDCEAAAAAVNASIGRAACLGVKTDVSDEDSVKYTVSEILNETGRIDILVNNAALYSTLAPVSFAEIEVTEWDKVMAVNLRGPFLMVKHTAPAMIAQGYGKIINISSGTVARGIPNFAHYVTSKGAVTAFTRAVSRELGEHNICVNSLAPGFTLSDSVINENPGHLDHSRAPSLARRAIKRDEYPEDLLGTLIFLASPDSDFITGQTIAVDGGANNT